VDYNVVAVERAHEDLLPVKLVEGAQQTLRDAQELESGDPGLVAAVVLEQTAQVSLVVLVVNNQLVPRGAEILVAESLDTVEHHQVFMVLLAAVQ
jgi:hypothetical protein